MTASMAISAPRVPNLIHGLLKGIEKVLGVAVASLLALLVTTVAAAVVARYLFNSSFAWTEEFAQWLFAAMIFLGLPIGGGVLAEMRVDLFIKMLHGRPRKLASHASEAVVLFSLVGLFTAASAVVATIGGQSPVLGIPEHWRFFIVTVGALLAVTTHLLRATVAGRSVLPRLVFVALVALAQWAFQEGWIHAPWQLSGSAVAAVAIAVALALAVPVPLAFLFGVLLAVFVGSVLPAPAVAQNLVNSSTRFLLLAIPFFLLTGTLISAGNLSRRIIRFAHTLVGHRRAGLAQTTLVTNSLFSCVSGSSIADAALGAKLLVPQLIAHGYPPPYAAALAASTAVLDNIIPPSVAFLILAAATNLSVGDLWLAGMGGGLVLAVALAVAIHWIGERWNGNEVRTCATWGERGDALRGALPVVGLACIIVIGIRFGAFTPTEAGVVAALYALALGLLVYRDYKPSQLFGLFKQSALETSSVGMLIGTGAPMGFLIAVDQVPTALVQGMGELAASYTAVAIGSILLLLLVGCFLDIGVALLIFGPLLMPLALSAGFDPIHFGLVVVVTTMIGGLHPPVGVLVYVVSGTTGISASSVFRAILPLIAALLAGLAVIVAFPRLALFFI
jgi:tripartite ATP-independent transporter DctM subunit